MKLLHKALAIQAPLVRAHIAAIRRRRPHASPAQVIRHLTRQFRIATIGSGIALGAAAAVPGLGTVAAIALTAGTAVGFVGVTALYVLSLAEIHGVAVQDAERRQALLLAVLLGEAGAEQVERNAALASGRWARQFVKSIPQSRIKSVNTALAKTVVQKYGTKRGLVVLGRLLPFGVGAVIGGAANAAFSKGVIASAAKAFGPAPKTWGPEPGRREIPGDGPEAAPGAADGGSAGADTRG